jgi:hypothetical protein
MDAIPVKATDGMILHELKAHLATAEPVTREFVALMEATFRHYGATRDHFLEQLPHHLLQSELISLVNIEIKSRLFDERFCEGIQDSLKSLRRAIIRLEDLRALHPEHPDTANNLTRLAALAERVEALYQKHWEFYRYQARLTEGELVSFLLEIDQVAYQWDTCLTGFSAVHAVAEALSGQPCPEELAPLRVTYQREGPQHFAVGTIQALIAFLETAYRFVCATAEVDPQAQPLTLLQVDVAHPVAVQLAVPQATVGVYRRFLQYLFLKDMLKREPLLKVVFEAVAAELGREKPLSPAALAGFQKDLNAALKGLPEDGRFTISDRTFPDDGIRVLQEFTADLDGKRIGYEALLRGDATKGRSRGAKAKADAKAPPPPDATAAAPMDALPAPPRPPGTGSLFSLNPKEHIAVLTGGRGREG